MSDFATRTIAFLMFGSVLFVAVQDLRIFIHYPSLTGGLLMALMTVCVMLAGFAIQDILTTPSNQAP